MSLDTSKCLCIQLSLHRHMSQCLLSCESQHVHVRMYIWLPSVCNIFNLWRNCVQIKTFSFTIRSWSNSKTCPTGYKMKKKKKIGVIWRCWFDWLAEREREGRQRWLVYSRQWQGPLPGNQWSFQITTSADTIRTLDDENVLITQAHLLLPCLEGRTWLAVWFLWGRQRLGGGSRDRRVCVCGVKRRLYMFVEAYVWPPRSGVDLGKSNLVESHNSTSLNISRWFLWKPHALQKD